MEQIDVLPCPEISRILKTSTSWCSALPAKLFVGDGDDDYDDDAL